MADDSTDADTWSTRRHRDKQALDRRAHQQHIDSMKSSSNVPVLDGEAMQAVVRRIRAELLRLTGGGAALAQIWQVSGEPEWRQSDTANVQEQSPTCMYFKHSDDCVSFPPPPLMTPTGLQRVGRRRQW